MSGSGPSPAEGSGHPFTLTPLLKALKTRDHEGLSKLRHALRTPLNQIIGYSELLMESIEETGRGEILPSLQRIHTGGGELLALINDALAAWKIEAGKVNFTALQDNLQAPLSGVITVTGQCIEQARTLGQTDAIRDLEKILRAAENLLTLANNTDPSALAGYGQSNSPVDETQEPATALSPTLLQPATQQDFGISNQPMPSARLLAVDDDDLNRDMLVRRLKKLGYDVTEAATGREALSRLKESSFDLILLDILMPDLDGFQTLEFMKADPRLKHLPVIMLTALDDVDSTVRCIEAGAEDYVPKPFNPVILRARITASLEKKRLRDQEQAFLTQLQVERAKSERLLLNVLPKAIAERLKAGQRTIVDSFIESTVLFADIVGFTRISSKQSPQRTVQLLNEFFSSFDRIAEQMDLEKIKTIGDAYMLVSGVPIIRPDHAEACAAAAMEMLEAVRQFNRRHQVDWSIRIGMNSGPVVAGIIGTRKFAYDLWGDTVNIASRMESHGQPGHIQVSEATKHLLEGKYVFEPVGVIPIKNSQPMPTYLLVRKIG
ncbi:response regulator [Oleiharenicola lentus]|uniref:histidine kinase n=1 Tax=Oleiharenicola lentus TaxID=2508720 RepID=A0A4V1M6V7_9BACT|nr:adenylate/guanylate cyclase domain-containing protein [Oleiharenicola lentus]RXK56739.1 response regulator [Oleiharenicola lentus]